MKQPKKVDPLCDIAFDRFLDSDQFDRLEELLMVVAKAAFYAGYRSRHADAGNVVWLPGAAPEDELSEHTASKGWADKHSMPVYEDTFPPTPGRGYI